MKDRTQTRERLLDAACRVFAADGYRDATVQDICAAAGANVAAVSYYFGSKRNLYLAVWDRLYETARRPTLDRLRAIADAQARLTSLIEDRVREAFNEGPGGCLRRLIHREMGDPTDLHVRIRNRYIMPGFNLLLDTVADLLGVRPSARAARYCAFSLHSQLVLLSMLRQKPDGHPMRRLLNADSKRPTVANGLARHLVVFARGGIAAARTPRLRPQRRSA